jgi:hypothetical protein
MQSQALELAGISYDDAFRIDESDIGKKLSDYHITILVQKFYLKVFEDKEEWFRSVLQHIYYIY